MKRKGYLSSSEIKKGKDKPKKVNRIKAMLKDNRNKFVCNHIDADTGKSKLKTGDSGKQFCKLCKAEFQASPKVINSQSLQHARDIMYAGVSIIRHEINLTDDFDAELIKFNELIHTIPLIYEDMENERKEKKNKHHHDKKKKKKGKNRFRRIN